MADPKPDPKKTSDPASKPQKERKKLTASLAMTRFQRMMEELDDKGRKSLLAFVRQLAEESTPPT